jgi:hypothetical protein
MSEIHTAVSDTDYEIGLLEAIELRENLEQEEESITYSEIYINVQSEDEFEITNNENVVKLKKFKYAHSK